MSSMVKEAKNLLKTNKLDDFGKLLNESWNLKKSISSNISNSFIDSIYDTAIKSGAIGGKLLGAGSGGFMMFYVPLKHQAKTKIALKKLLNIPFNFENYGSHIIYNSNTKNE